MSSKRSRNDESDNLSNKRRYVLAMKHDEYSGYYSDINKYKVDNAILRFKNKDVYIARAPGDIKWIKVTTKFDEEREQYLNFYTTTLDKENKKYRVVPISAVSGGGKTDKYKLAESDDYSGYYSDIKKNANYAILRFNNKDVYLLKVLVPNLMKWIVESVKFGDIREEYFKFYTTSLQEDNKLFDVISIPAQTGGGKNKYKININKQTNFIYVLVDNKKVYLYKDENNKLFITLNKKVKFINKKQIKRDSASNIYINV